MEQPLPMSMLPLPHGSHLMPEGHPDHDDDPYGPPGGLDHGKDDFLHQPLLPPASSLAQPESEPMTSSLKQEITDLSLNGSAIPQSLNTDSMSVDLY